MKSDSPPRLLLLGPLPKANPNHVGGAYVSFCDLIRYLKSRAYPHKVVDIKFLAPAWGLPINYLWVLFWAVRLRSQYDVIWINASYRGFLYLTPVLLCLAGIFGKKLVLRPFGNLWFARYRVARAWRKWHYAWILRNSSLVFVQTKEQINFLEGLDCRTAHLPTSRPKPKEQFLRVRKKFEGNLVFLGHLKPDKGIDQLLALGRQLPAHYKLHLYGPLQSQKYRDMKMGQDEYQGVLKTNDVRRTLSQYDALLLPTFYPGEGYPGVIVEAFSLGMPVIGTRWGGIPELIEDGKNGFLIEPRSTVALADAVERLALADYGKLSRAARATFKAKLSRTPVLDAALSHVVKL